MSPLGCYHWSQIIAKLKCSKFFCRGPQSPTSGTLEPPGHHFMKGWLAHIVRTNTDGCSVEAARPSLLNLFCLKVASLVKGICSVCTCELLCCACLRGRERQHDFCLAAIKSIIVIQTVWIDLLQQPEIFKPTSLTFFPKQNVYITLDLSSLRHSRRDIWKKKKCPRQYGFSGLENGFPIANL